MEWERSKKGAQRWDRLKKVKCASFLAARGQGCRRGQKMLAGEGARSESATLRDELTKQNADAINPARAPIRFVRSFWM